MIGATAALVVLLCAYAYFRWSRRRLHELARQVPDVSPPLPLIGHAHYFLRDTVKTFENMKWIFETTNRLEGVSKMWLGPQLIYTLTDPEDVAVALNSCTEKNYFFSFFRNWVGDGLITSKVSIWKYRHKKLLPAFNQKILNGFIPIFNKQSSVLVEAMLREKEHTWFNPQDHIGATTLEMICQTAMGVPKDQKSIVDPSYLAAAHLAESVLAKRCLKIWLYPDFMYRLLGHKKIEDEALRILKKVSCTIVKTKRVEYEDKLKQNLPKTDERTERPFRAFLDLMLELSKEDNTFTDEVIREEVDTMIIAGQETTAATTNFALLLLGSHQDKQEKAFDEIRSIFADNDREVMKEDLPKLVYLEAVVNETLRLFPIVPVIIRQVVEEVKLKTCTLAKGSSISVSTWGLHHHERWGADYDSFRPERWFDPACVARSQGAFCAFGAGKRMCLGKTYAMMSIKTMLVHVLRNYRVHSDIQQLQLSFSLILKHHAGSSIKLEKRQKSRSATAIVGF